MQNLCITDIHYHSKTFFSSHFCLALFGSQLLCMNQSLVLQCWSLISRFFKKIYLFGLRVSDLEQLHWYRILKTSCTTPRLYSTYVIASSVSLTFTRNQLHQVHVSITHIEYMEIGNVPLSFRYSVSGAS